MKTALHIFAGYAIAFIALWLIGGFIVMDWDYRNWKPFGRFAVAWFAFAGCIIAIVMKEFK